VLREVAQRLRGQLRAGDTAARLGGDEFVVLLDPVDTEASAVEVAQRVIAAMSQPIPLGLGSDAQVGAEVGASVGVAFNQDSGTDADALLHEADVAVYRAKAAGRRRVEVFSRAVGAELEHRVDVDSGPV